MLALAKKLLFGVAFFLSLLPAFAGKYPDEAHSTRTTVTVHVVWLPSYNAVTHLCSWIGNEPPPELPSIILGCYERSTRTIYAVQPKSFNDHERLHILGHEFWHALGAEHPEI